MERARSDLWQHLGFRWEDDLATNPDKYHVVAEHQIRYVTPVRGEGDVCIELTPRKLGTSSLIIAAKMMSMDERVLHAEGTTRLVRLDPVVNRPCAWTDRFRRAVEPFVRSEP
jgi:acyl-CoA thioester hydrolase